MADSIALWHKEHANFGRLLDLLERQLGQFHRGDSIDYELMLDVMYYMTHYPDISHHPKEDLAFARLSEYELGARAIVDELSAQHARLRQIGERLMRALDDVVNGSLVSREEIEAQGRAYADLFRRHMSREESEILPLAGRLLTASDWAAINAQLAHLDDPLYAAAEKRYATLRTHIGA
jgi:hemerythrin-like domain-containing protein